jgi:hypothetical protein
LANGRLLFHGRVVDTGRKRAIALDQVHESD